MRRVIGSALIIALVCGVANATAAERIRVTVAPERGGVRYVEGRFSVPASIERARAVLSDYEGLPRFASGVRSSRIVERAGRRSVVEQVLTGRLSLFRKTMHLRLEVFETPTSISFRDLSHRSFAVYEGSWGLMEGDGGTEVVYELKARPAFFVPGFLSESMFRNAIERQLAEIKDEILEATSTR